MERERERYNLNPELVQLPVIIVSSRALFMRSTAFSLVGAHTISCILVPKLPNWLEQFVAKTSNLDEQPQGYYKFRLSSST